jgi:hypothetical protein
MFRWCDVERLNSGHLTKEGSWYYIQDFQLQLSIQILYICKQMADITEVDIVNFGALCSAIRFQQITWFDSKTSESRSWKDFRYSATFPWSYLFW